jgi:DNA-binding GntR family transcriptional regulator
MEQPSFSSTSYQRVHEHLREMIITGQIAAGTRLKIADIAGQYAISQMPVREALQQLQGEGLVVIAPNKGATVRSMDRKFISNIFDIRIALETYLTRKACECMTAETLQELEAIEGQLERAGDLRDMAAHVRLNMEFHRAILAATGNEEAIRLLDLHGNLIGAMRLRYGFRPGRSAAVQEEHRALIHALRRGDAEAAGAIHQLHISSARDDLLATMAEAGLS